MFDKLHSLAILAWRKVFGVDIGFGAWDYLDSPKYSIRIHAQPHQSFIMVRIREDKDPEDYKIEDGETINLSCMGILINVLLSSGRKHIPPSCPCVMYIYKHNTYMYLSYSHARWVLKSLI